MPLVSSPVAAATATTASISIRPETCDEVAQVPQLTRLQRKPSFMEKPTPRDIKTPHLQLTVLQPERCSTAIAPLAYLANIERIEINGTRERDGVTYYVLAVFLHHFNTRLPANLSYLRRAALESDSAATPVKGRKPDYHLERRFSEFCDLRAQVYEVACLNPQHQCQYCNEFIVYVRFKSQQPRTLTKITTTSISKRKTMLRKFINDFVGMAQCRHMQNRKCESHDAVPTLLEYFVRDHGREGGESGSSSPLLQLP